jgi:hypothetical protein
MLELVMALAVARSEVEAVMFSQGNKTLSSVVQAGQPTGEALRSSMDYSPTAWGFKVLCRASKPARCSPVDRYTRVRSVSSVIPSLACLCRKGFSHLPAAILRNSLASTPDRALTEPAVAMSTGGRGTVRWRQGVAVVVGMATRLFKRLSKPQGLQQWV